MASEKRKEYMRQYRKRQKEKNCCCECRAPAYRGLTRCRKHAMAAAKRTAKLRMEQAAKQLTSLEEAELEALREETSE